MGSGTGDWEPWRKGGGVQELGKDGAGNRIPKMVGKGRNGKNCSQHCAPSLLPTGERGGSQQKKGQELKLMHTRSRMFRPLPPPPPHPSYLVNLHFLKLAVCHCCSVGESFKILSHIHITGNFGKSCDQNRKNLNTQTVRDCGH